MEKATKRNKKEAQPVLIVKPVSKTLGLDYLHISLIALVIILVALAFALSGFRPGQGVINCPYGIMNSSCAGPIHTSAQALSAAEQALVGYSDVNTSLSLLPYYSLVNQSSVSYLNASDEWLVVIPYRDPLLKNQTFSISLLLYDSNLTLVTPYLQTLKPPYQTVGRTVAFGVVNITGRVLCTTTTPVPMYTFIDPYAPGAIAAIYKGINASAKYGNEINNSYKFIYTGYAQKYYSTYGINQTQLAGRYLFCASKQPSKFVAFLKNYSIESTGNPLDNLSLEGIVVGSGLNTTKFDSCLLYNSTQILDAQASLASFYNVSMTPAYVVNCKYETIPQTLYSAINYTLGGLNTTK
ncbi:MAG: hypothetical protein M1504_02745 [Candidatus Marsarchaeota archaeon]|nr:hypothetical protein [Candidatus Marsarchaeota archaeon]